MLGITFARIFKAALKNMWRNVWLTVATLLIMSITLLMMNVLYFANVFGNETLRSIEKRVDVSVFFKDSVEDGQVESLAKEMELRDDVERVRIKTPDEAKDELLRNNPDQSVLEESFQELDENPLPYSMYVVATSPEHYGTIANYLEREELGALVEKVNYKDSSNKRVIDKLIAISNSAKNGALVATGLFALLATLIMFNTVRLAIYSFREEIEIMRLVGASRWFVQGPFILEAMMVSLMAVGLTTVIVYPALQALAPYLQQYFLNSYDNTFNIYNFALDNWTTVVGMQLVVAVGLATLSSFIAIRRYLRN